MDRLRTISLFVALVAAVALVAGCGGGSKTQSIISPYYGSLDGVDTVPQDGDADAPIDTWIEVFWPEPFAPPREFTVKLEKEESTGNWSVVRTTLLSLESHPYDADWWFAPNGFLSSFTRYRIRIKDARTGETVIHEFVTGDWMTRLSSREVTPSSTTINKRYRPQGAENAPSPADQGQVEHTIKVNR